MRQNSTAFKCTYLIYIIPILIYLVWISYGLSLRDFADDRFFLRAFMNGDVISFLEKRYMTWSGRLSIELLILYTIGHSIFWKIGVPFAIALSCFSFCRISSTKPSLPLFAFCFVLYALIPLNLNIGSAWWITGFYNYLLPLSIALYVFSVALRSNSNVERVISILMCFYFPYMEQIGICFTIAMIILLIMNRDRRYLVNYIILALALINTMICVIAPGNFLRATHETWSWFPQYQLYGSITKIALGFDKIHQAITFNGNVPAIACFGLISYLGLSARNASFALRASSVILAIYTSLLIASSLTEHSINPDFMSGQTIFSTQWDGISVFVSYFIMLLAISSSFLILFSLRIHGERVALTSFAMLIGYMSVMMLSFSPTVYASGMRVDYILEFMFILSCCCLVSFLPCFSNEQSVPTQ